MPNYKLTYWNGRGRGELIRLVFHAAGVKFEDVRVDKEQWTTLKPTTPFGQMPVLEIDGVKLCQSNTIARYVAKTHHLAGKTELEHAQADMIVDCLEDSIKPIVSLFFEQDETKKAEIKKKFNDEQLPGYLGLLEKILIANHGGDHFFVGSHLTWADLAFVNFIGWGSYAGVDEAHVLDKFPKLKALKEKVEKEPKVAAYLASRPKE